MGGTAIAGQGGAQYHKRDFWADENLKYAQPHFRMRKVAREVRRIARGRECDLLDVGCGPGTLARLMPPGVRYHGVDIAIPAPAPNLIEMDIIEEPVSFRGQTFDVIVAQGLFEYAGEFQAKLFAEIAGLLNEGGRFVLTYQNFGHRKQEIYWPYSNVQPPGDFRRELSRFFRIERSYPGSHNWNHSQPGRTFMKVSQARLTVNIPSSARSWRWTTCTSAPPGSGYGKITNIAPPGLWLRSLTGTQVSGRRRPDTGSGATRGAFVNKTIFGMLAGACFILAGCSSPHGGHAAGPPSSAASKSGMSIHVCLGNTEAELLKWRDHNGGLSGTFEYLWLSGKAPSEAFNSISSDLSGTLRGTAITLNLGFSHPLRGKLDGGQFSLNIPQPHGTTKTLICQPGNMADWNNATAALTNQVNQDNNRPASPAGG